VIGPAASATGALVAAPPASAAAPGSDLRATHVSRPWYRRGWVWGVIGGVAAAAIVGGVVGHYASQPPPTTVQLTCCK
jgi:hypothetical protein